MLRFEKSRSGFTTSKLPGKLALELRHETTSKAIMKICAKCGFENDENAKQCANCLIDIHWAKVNLGKFQGTAEDTRKIGIESRKQRGLPVPEDDMTPLPPVKPVKNEDSSDKVSFATYLLWILLLRVLSFGLINKGFHSTGELINSIIAGVLLGWVFWSKANQTNLTNEIKTAESFQWSWRRAIQIGCVGWLLTLVFVIVVVLFDSSSGTNINANNGSYSSLLICLSGMIISLAIALPTALIGGISVKKVETKTYPNQGVWLSIKNTLFITLVFGTITWLVQTLVLNKVEFLYIVLFFALWGGGVSVVQHYTLRLILWSKRNIPWNYARFLDYAAERIFLRKVGGSYIFIHRLMMEHFAGLGETGKEV